MNKDPARNRSTTHRIIIDDALRLGLAVHQGGNPLQAVEHYRAILEVAPAHVDAMHYLGVALHQTGDTNGALSLLEHVLAAAPDYVDARNNLGNMLKEAGRFAQAEQAYREVIAARPYFVAAHGNLGVVLNAQGRHAEAIAAYRKALELAPAFAEGWNNLGNALKATDDEHGALSAYRNAIMLSPTNIEGHRNLGAALVAYKRYNEALEVYRRWQQVEPDNSIVAHLIAACAGGHAPARASDAFVQQTFDRFADNFDTVLARLEYRAPALCAEMISDLLGGPRQAFDVLDAGCGTGLCAPYLRPYARKLHGVDLSARMLAKAAVRASYDKLDEGELTAWLAAHRGAFDLVVSADTLCYFGNLDPVMRVASSALRPGGLLVFTVEQTVEDSTAPQFQLHPHGRYSHAVGYVREVLAGARLEVADIRYVTLRLEAKIPVRGLVVGAVP